jgi:hypothetical protein
MEALKRSVEEVREAKPAQKKATRKPAARKKVAKSA